ncbi:dethiobiotin synthase [bacterium]|nr:dethiobiotin synthase [bacterium]
MNNVFIAGINSGCGKTVISAGIAAVMQSLGYKTGVYKPIQTGAINKEKYLISPDLAFVKMLDPYITTHSTYMFAEKTLPAITTNSIEMQDISKDFHLLSEKTDTLIVESIGGLMTPLNKNLFTYNIPLAFKLPVVFVVSPSNDSVNNYFNEINTAKTAGLDIQGVIINKYPVDSENPEIKSFPTLIEEYCDVKVLGLIRSFKGDSVQANTLITEILNGIDLEDLFRMKIPKLNGY